MNYFGMSVVYILNRYAFRIYYFVYHWYFRGFRKASNWTINYLEKMDYKFALRVNLQNIFQPLFQDYSMIGHILGFVSRSIRIAVASIIYFIFIIFCAILFLIWAVFPIFVLYKIITSFPG